MILAKFYFCLIPLLLNFNDTSKNNIVIIGQPYNEKDGAWVLSNGDKKHYFVDGIESWDEKIVGKPVKVWGRLFIEKLESPIRNHPEEPGVPPPPIPQQMEDSVKRTILKAKWELHQSPKERAFVNTVKEVIVLLSKRDSVGLSEYTSQQGVYLLFRVGVFDRYSQLKKMGFSDTTYPNAPFYDGVRYIKIHYSKIPVYDCEKWTRTGVFTDTSRIDHLLSKTAKNGNTYATQQTTAKTIASFYSLELKSRRIVVADNNGNELIFYLSYLNNRWWLTIIDKVTTDCSV